MFNAKEYKAAWYQANRERIAEERKRKYAADPGEAKHRTQEWRKANREKARELSRRYWRQLREQMIEAYGAACACCGEKNPKFLALDHTNGDGSEERRKSGKPFSNANIIKQLRRDGWPKGRHQLLCHNCNCARGFYGSCCSPS